MIKTDRDMETLKFELQGNHESHSGEATIVEDYNEGTIYVMNNLPWEWDEINTNKIGNYKGYDVYENYVDSRGDDHSYFAVKTNKAR